MAAYQIEVTDTNGKTAVVFETSFGFAAHAAAKRYALSGSFTRVVGHSTLPNIPSFETLPDGTYRNLPR